MDEPKPKEDNGSAGVVGAFWGLKEDPQEIHGAKAEAENKHDAEGDGYETDEGQGHGGEAMRREIFAAVVAGGRCSKSCLPEGTTGDQSPPRPPVSFRDSALTYGSPMVPVAHW